ncbi:methyltransferase, TIGR04325 family [Leptospira fletcheri]|uniref:Methyltransferase, TIGR04325 family n=1 Tax=Leptospira fletcheri TaxID=2484981 RepID=A0A4R9GFL6_9LEPT|nr:methyltransferase, TIGR04325 family [Leptospira fletcheri]TGK09947.1 methyltransferase, TIGR04325 family [Leptospira fletcheri]
MRDLRHFIGRVLRKLSLYFLESPKEHLWFNGNFTSWSEASKECDTYASPNILEAVKNSLLKVKSGEAVYERDSVLFDKIEYSLPALIGLLYATASEKGRLNVLDFGGSLGSSYFQNRGFLSCIKDLKWSIVEQKHFVEEGLRNFKDGILNFYYSIEECMEEVRPNVLLLSSVLPYLPDPYATLHKLLSHDFKYVIVDRTPFLLNGKPDRILIETVPPEIYEAEYPIWFFNRERFLEYMNFAYELKGEFFALDPMTLKGEDTAYKAFIFTRK